MKRGDILTKILETLENGIMGQIDFIDAMLASGYGASMNKLDYEYVKRHETYENKKLELKNLKEKKLRLQKFLYKLKQDGLIKEVGKNDKKLAISQKGKVKLKELKNKISRDEYKSEVQDESIIISFDIPEHLRKKRGWLRDVIKNLGFKMVHQSVWISKIKIPRQLIVDLERIGILEYVEIFEISKTGSLNKIGEK